MKNKFPIMSMVHALMLTNADKFKLYEIWADKEKAQLHVQIAEGKFIISFEEKRT